MKIKFTFIIPVYNVENYISECLESIINQTYQSFEIILIDDGSSDNSGCICDEYTRKFPFIHVIHQKNQGTSVARNTGIEMAKGEYIFFIDSDDWVNIELAEEVNKVIEEHNSDIIFFKVKEIFKDREKEWDFKTRDDIKLKRDMILGNVSGSACDKCFKRTLFEKFKFPVKFLYEDYYLVPEIVCASRKINVIDRSLYYYRRTNESSITYKPNNSINLYWQFRGRKHNEEVAGKYNLNIYDKCEKNTIYAARRCMFMYYKDGLLNLEQIEDIKEYLMLKKIRNLKTRFWINRILNNDVSICKFYASLKGYYK